MKNKFMISILFLSCVIGFCVFFSSCTTVKVVKERLWMSHGIPTEPEWIRNGEPIAFEGESWYPADAVENLLDSELYPVGEYRGIQVFVEMTDVRPFERLYTRFAKNKFRFFERKK